MRIKLSQVKYSDREYIKLCLLLQGVIVPKNEDITTDYLYSTERFLTSFSGKEFQFNPPEWAKKQIEIKKAHDEKEAIEASLKIQGKTLIEPTRKVKKPVSKIPDYTNPLEYRSGYKAPYWNICISSSKDYKKKHRTKFKQKVGKKPFKTDTLIVNQRYESNSHPMPILAEDFKDSKSLIAFLQKMTTSYGKKLLGDIDKYDYVILPSMAIEGIHFIKIGGKYSVCRKHRSITETDNVKSFQPLTGEAIQAICIDEKFYITHGDTDTLKSALHAKPIKESEFLQNLMEQYLGDTVNAKITKSDKIIELENQLSKLHKEIGELIFVENAVKDKSDSFFMDILKSIRNSQDVVSLTLIEGGFIIKTSELWADLVSKSPRVESRHYIGPFEIVFEFIGGFSIRYRNFASPNEYGHSPHGNCSGSHTSVIGSSLRRLDYYTAVMSVIEMLRSVNPHEKTREGLNESGWVEDKKSVRKFYDQKGYNTLSISHYLDREESPHDVEDDYDDDDYEEEEDDDDYEEESEQDLDTNEDLNNYINSIDA